MRRVRKETLFKSDYLDKKLAQKSIKGGSISMAAQIVQFVVSTIGIIILARLLTPSDFGLIGMVMVFLGFAEMFKDAGLSMATIQRDHISHEEVSTLFWVNVLISGILGVCILAVSPLVGRFYGRPELTGITAVLSISFIVSGVMIQHQALLKRHMQFGALAAIQIVSQIAKLGVTIFLALLGWRYWALVGGAITMAFIGTMMTFFLCPWIPGRLRMGSGVREMLTFGGHVTGFSFANYFSRNADNILIGKFIGADALGLYERAYTLFMMPIHQLRGPIINVALPVLSAIKEQPERYLKYYQRLLDIMASLTIPLTLYCVLEAEFIIRLLLGPQWIGTVPVFRILAIAGVIQPIASTRGLVLLSFGYSKRYFVWGLANSVLTVIAFVVGLPFGIKGVAAAYACENYLILIPSLYYCFHNTPVTVSMFLKTIAFPLGASGLAAAMFILLKNTSTSLSVTSHMYLLGVFAVTYFSISYCRKSVRETVRIFLENFRN